MYLFSAQVRARLRVGTCADVSRSWCFVDLFWCGACLEWRRSVWYIQVMLKERTGGSPTNYRKKDVYKAQATDEGTVAEVIRLQVEEDRGGGVCLYQAHAKPRVCA